MPSRNQLLLCIYFIRVHHSLFLLYIDIFFLSFSYSNFCISLSRIERISSKSVTIFLYSLLSQKHFAVRLVLDKTVTIDRVNFLNDCVSALLTRRYPVRERERINRFQLIKSNESRSNASEIITSRVTEHAGYLSRFALSLQRQLC